MYVCVPYVYLVPEEARKECQIIPWKSESEIVNNDVGTETKPRSSERAANTNDYWVNSSVPEIPILSGTKLPSAQQYTHAFL